MGSELERLKHRLFGEGQMGARNVKIFRGDNADATAEEIAGQMNLALDEIAAGKAELIEEFDD